MLPIGPPDPEAREALWRQSCEQAGAYDVDLAALVQASDAFTPADIGHASQQVAQSTFEATLSTGGRVRAGTREYLAAIRQTRPTLDADAIAHCQGDRANYQRV